MSELRTSATGSGYLLPTPTATSYGYNRGGSAGRVGPKRPSIDTIAKSHGLCELAIREWAMGWPIGWTALEPLETDKWHEWLRWHGPNCYGGTADND
jgi:hypothetical protein